MYLYYCIIYLGFFTAATASVMVMVSGMKKVLEIFDRSQALEGVPQEAHEGRIWVLAIQRRDRACQQIPVKKVSFKGPGLEKHHR